MSTRFLPYRVFETMPTADGAEAAVHRLVREGVVTAPVMGYDDEAILALLRQKRVLFPGMVLQLEYSAARVYFVIDFDGHVSGPTHAPKVAV